VLPQDPFLLAGEANSYIMPTTIRATTCLNRMVSVSIVELRVPDGEPESKTTSIFGGRDIARVFSQPASEVQFDEIRG
jgi:hypothetical protein